MKLRPFELTLVVIFIILIALSLFFISTYKAKKDTNGLPEIGTIMIWGTLPKEGIDKTIKDLSDVNQQYRGVTYREINPNTFDTELVNAIADGNGPDLVLIAHERLVSLRSKIKPISYKELPQRDIQTAYVDGAQIFALSDGFYARPLMVDPLVMYWNKNILATDNFLQAPATWESLVNEYLPTLVRRNPDRSITRSVVALGEYQNVQNAFGILSMILLQAGTGGVTNDSENFYQIRLNTSRDTSVEPLKIAADFYTRFSKPSNTLYSWNRSFSLDRDRFLSEDLAMYFGYGSEAPELARQNPNLSFDIAEVPQGANATVRRTYGRFYGLAELNSSRNPNGAFIVMGDFTRKENAEKIAQLYSMSPVLRASVMAGSSDIYGTVIYKSAGITYGWLSPRKEAVDSIFTTMTQDINENRKDVIGAVGDALGRLGLEYN